MNAKTTKTKDIEECFGKPVLAFRIRVDRTGSNQSMPIREIDKFYDESIRKKTIVCDKDFRAFNFQKSSNHLKLDSDYDVYDIPISIGATVMPADCAEWLKKNGYALFGPQILPFANKDKKKLVGDKWYVSLDVEGNMFRRGDYKMIPCLRLDEIGAELQFAVWHAPLDGSYSLLAVKKL